MMVADLFLAQSLVKKVRLNRALHDDDSLTFPRLLARFPPPARRLIESTPARPQTTRITHKLVVARASTCFMRTTHQKPTWTLSRAVKGLELPLPYELGVVPFARRLVQIAFGFLLGYKYEVGGFDGPTSANDRS